MAPRLAVLAAVVAAVLIAAPLARAADDPYPMFGVNVDRVFNDDFWQTHWDERLSAVHDAGIGLVRSDAFWDWAEPQPPQNGVRSYRWDITDSVARAVTEHGLRWLPILDYSTAWSSSDPSDTHAPPSSNDDYAAYAGAFASRFGRGGSFWTDNPDLPYTPVTTYEIWNEEDLNWFWRPAPDPARYIDMYLRARAAIKAADPDATVLVGGLVPDSSYVQGMFAARPDAAGQVDGVALHPYSATVDGVFANVRSLRRTLESLGLGGVPIYVTELGWPTSGGSALVVPEDQRAAMTEQATDSLARSDCGIAAVIPYTWTTPDANAANSDDWFGMWHWAGGRTSTGDAYARVVARWQTDPVTDATRLPICHPPPSADLSATATASAPQVTAGGVVTYALSIANSGSDPAQDATATATLPAGVTVVGASASAGSCAPPPVVQCSLGSIAEGQTATVTVVARADALGGGAATVAASSGTPDPNAANNSTSAAVQVVPPPFTGVVLRRGPASVRHRRVRLVASCPRGTWQRCVGSLRLVLPHGAGRPSAKFRIPPGARRTLSIRLGRATRRLRLPASARLSLVARDGAGQLRSARARIRLRAR